MKVPDLIATGWVEIWAHKMRSFLSFFAIAIGIATFFYTLSILSQSYRRLDESAVVSGVGRIDTKTNHSLTLSQYKDLNARLPQKSSLSFVTDPVYLWGDWIHLLYHQQKLGGCSIVGVMPTWKDSSFVYQLDGRFINWKDVENRHRVAVITVFPNEKNKRRLWGDRNHDRKVVSLREFTSHHNLLNQDITINNETFKVVGLLRVPTTGKDVRFERDQEEEPMIYIPYTTWQTLFSKENGRDDTSIRVVTGKESSAKVAANTIKSYLRGQYGINEKPEITFFYEKLQERITHARKSLQNMLFMGIIAMIAGGIGIMNVTMAVIFSRTKEIGIRRALGASKTDILFQFVTEAMLLGFCGAIAGMILGYAALLHLAEDTSQMTFSWWVIVSSVLIALVTSFLFALYPAWQAAKLKPVEALKNE